MTAADSQAAGSGPAVTGSVVVGDVILAVDTTRGAGVVFSATDGGQRADLPYAGDLTHGGSPRWFLYAKAVAPDGPVELFAADEEFSLSTQLTSDAAMRIVTWAWSPDGTRVAFAGTRVDEQGLVVEQGTYVGDVVFDAGSRPVGLAGVRFAFTMEPGAIAWSADNRRLTFAQAVAGQSDLFVGDVDSGVVLNVSATPSVSEYTPAFSPVDERIAFVRRTSKGGPYRNDVFVMNLRNGRVTQVTNKANANVVQIGHPAFSPAGTDIAFSAFAVSLTATADIYRIRADGSAKAVNLTTSSANNHYFPRWRR